MIVHLTIEWRQSVQYHCATVPPCHFVTVSLSSLKCRLFLPYEGDPSGRHTSAVTVFLVFQNDELTYSGMQK